jgi:phosphoribosylanthranilate isomerase
LFVKIDGVMSSEDAWIVVEAGAAAMGFIFAPSRRQVASGHVRDVVRGLPRTVLTIAVFVDAPREFVVDTVTSVGLGGAQLHGNESAADTSWIRSRIPIVLKAFAVDDPRISRADEWGADAIIVDCPGGGGGRGIPYDWSLARVVPTGIPWILAGGLTPDNVADAIKVADPNGVDVSSGVEASRGRKDPVKTRLFVERARLASSGALGSRPSGRFTGIATEPSPLTGEPGAREQIG